MRKNNKNKGFTLVELLIVVAIIGILAAVLTPQFLNARRVAADKAAEAFAHNIYTAVQATVAEVGALPTGGDYDTDCGTDTSMKDSLTIGQYKIQVPLSGIDLVSCSVSENEVKVVYKGGVSSLHGSENGETTGQRSFTIP